MKKKLSRAFSLVEILVSLFIIMVLVLSIYPLVNYSLQITADNKNYVQAISIANQRMEQIRALPYDDVGTTLGTVHGLINDNEVVYRNGKFDVNTIITFYDDDYDGLLEDENDDFIDYKTATVKVSWQSKNGIKEVIMSSKVISATQEIPEGWGLLKLSVLDFDGNPIDNVTVNIKNPNLAPGDPLIDVDYTTGNTNILSIPVLPNHSYEITVSKDGYSIDKTHTVSETNPNPTKPNLEVNIGEKTEASFNIDLISKFNIRTVRASLPQNHIINSDYFDQLNPAVDSYEEYSYFVWENFNNNRIYLQKYDLNGVSQWEYDEEVISSGINELPDVKVIKDSNIATCFTKEIINYDNVYVSFYSSDGNNLEGPYAIDSSIANQTNCKLAYSSFSTSTVVVWEDARDFESNNNDIYIKIYNDDLSLLSTSRVNVGTAFNQHDPGVSVDSNGNIYVVWTDNRNNGDEDIYMQKFNSSGNRVWEDGDKRVNVEINANQHSPSIAIDTSDNIYVVWTDNRNNGDEDIYMQKFNSSGNRVWEDGDKRVNVETNANQHSPSIAIDTSDNIYVVWTDNRNINNNSNEDVYLQKLSVDGSKYSRDYRVNTNIDPTSQNLNDLSISNNYPIVVWADNRLSSYDIFFTKFIEYNNPTSASNINIDIVGTKQIGNNPIIYKYDATINSGSNGYISEYEVEGDGSGYTINANDVLMIDPSSPVKISPNQTREIMIYLQ